MSIEQNGNENGKIAKLFMQTDLSDPVYTNPEIVSQILRGETPNLPDEHPLKGIAPELLLLVYPEIIDTLFQNFLKTPAILIQYPLKLAIDIIDTVWIDLIETFEDKSIDLSQLGLKGWQMKLSLNRETSSTIITLEEPKLQGGSLIIYESNGQLHIVYGFNDEKYDLTAPDFPSIGLVTIKDRAPIHMLYRLLQSADNSLQPESNGTLIVELFASAPQLAGLLIKAM
jgi:hypothetical protein